MIRGQVTLAHGNGGRLTRRLITEIFVPHLSNPALDVDTDAAAVRIESRELLMTTDSFTVQPLEFPGGDIGSLAVHGTVNDMAVAGGVPLYMSLNVVIEEGFELAQLERIAASLGNTARACGVAVVCGDTKVVPRGHGGGLYLSTTGVGYRVASSELGPQAIREGDAILISGPPGEHGTAVLLAREEFDLRAPVISDSASVLPLTQALADLPGLRFMRDPTRGGLATVAADIARITGRNVELDQSRIPTNVQVEAICDMLGFEMLHLACEGRVMAVIEAEQSRRALELWRQFPGGADAAIIGRVTALDDPRDSPMVVLRTAVGGERVLEELEHDPLPRIC